MLCAMHVYTLIFTRTLKDRDYYLLFPRKKKLRYRNSELVIVYSQMQVYVPLFSFFSIPCSLPLPNLPLFHSAVSSGHQSPRRKKHMGSPWIYILYIVPAMR